VSIPISIRPGYVSAIVSEAASRSYEFFAHVLGSVPFAVEILRRNARDQVGERLLFAQAQLVGPNALDDNILIGEIVGQNNARPSIRFPGANDHRSLVAVLPEAAQDLASTPLVIRTHILPGDLRIELAVPSGWHRSLSGGVCDLASHGSVDPRAAVRSHCGSSDCLADGLPVIMNSSRPIRFPFERRQVPMQPELDRNQALEFVGGDTRLLHELAQLFLDSYPAELTAVRTACERQDLSALARAAHAMKGSIRIFGASAFEAALRVEALARSGDATRIAAACDALEAALAGIRPALLALAAEEDG
jgi:HPt (histidine-containing phosphotransfer) domain-containing protein